MKSSFVKIFFQKRYALPIITSVAAFVLCFLWLSSGRAAFYNLKQIMQTSEGQRKGRVYASYGYDYITYITSIIPEPWIFPVTRYINYTHNIDILLPVNSRTIDRRVLIGIDIPDEDMKEAVITTAHRLVKQSDGRVAYWTFNTIQDYDTLTGFHFLMNDASSVLPTKITLFKNSSETEILGSWMFEPDKNEKDQTVYTLPVRLKNFSFNRGSEDFVIKLEQPEYTSTNMFSNIEYIGVNGVKVDLGDYQIVHRSGRNFTALTHDFLHTIEKDDMKAWKQFLSEVQQ